MKQHSSLLVFCTQLLATGGIESHILEFCNHLSASGIRITLVVPNFQMKSDDEKKLNEWCQAIYINRGRAGVKTMSWLFATAMQLGFTSFDAVYTNGQGESIGFFAALLWKKKRWVHHHHTAGDALDQATWGPKYRATLKKADMVIACSQRNALEMQKVLNRPIDTVPCFSREIEVPERGIDPAGKVSFGYYGRLIVEKGIDTLCRLSEDKDCKQIEFNIWGQGEAYPSSFFDAWPNLKFHGTFSGIQGLIKVIGSLDGFLLLSTHPEGLPVCLLEAMGAGLPWLATNKGGIPDIAVDPMSTRVIPYNADYEEMKKQVLLFAADIREGHISRYKQMENYQHKFSAPVLVKQWQQVLCIS